MLTSFYTGLTGLNANGQAINVIGNNLANINTYGFKASRASFAELLGGTSFSTNGNPQQVGLGVTSAGISPILTQGAIQVTGRSTDMAINGNGYFLLGLEDGGRAYTRSGNFSLSSDGELVSSDGYSVMGYPAINGSIDLSAAPTAIIVQKGQSLPPQATTNVSLNANLDAATAVDDSFSTTIQIYDTLGAAHSVSFVFTKTGSGAWDWESTIPAVDTGGLVTDPPVVIGTGTLTFDSAGVLTAPTANPTLSIAGLANGAADMDFDFEILDDEGNSRLTGFTSVSTVSSTRQNGHASSVLKDVNVDATGMLNGIFDNGQVQALGQLAIATFGNDEGLLKFGGASFVTTLASGEASIGTAGSGGRGSVSGQALELSNVDIAQEFTSMIVSQRGYQANSRVINTTDELYQDILALKR